MNRTTKSNHKSFRAETGGTTTYLNNQSPTKGLQVTAEERFIGMKQDFSDLHVCGTRVMTYIPKVRRKKWDPKSEAGIFVGYAFGSKGCRIYNPRTRNVFVSRDAMFLNEGSNKKQPSATATSKDFVRIHDCLFRFGLINGSYY